MNYQKIYAAFITDRRASESHPLIQYVEKHHIVPRAKGGGDETENLIYLTPEDHFFAHLLLAKIYGGKMWLALVLMTASHAMCYGQARRLHGFAARRAQIDKAPDAETKARMLATQQARAPRFEFVNVDTGARFSGTGFEFREHTGMPQCSVSRIVTGRTKIVNGWAFPENAGARRDNRKVQAHVFVDKDGRIFAGTMFDFRTKYDIEASSLTGLISGKRKTTKGWTYAGKA